jgi:hypothetical protein
MIVNRPLTLNFQESEDYQPFTKFYYNLTTKKKSLSAKAAFSCLLCYCKCKALKHKLLAIFIISRDYKMTTQSSIVIFNFKKNLKWFVMWGTRNKQDFNILKVGHHTSASYVSWDFIKRRNEFQQSNCLRKNV